MHEGANFTGPMDYEAVRLAALDLCFSLPKIKDDPADYQSLEDASIPLDYDRDRLPEVGMTKNEIRDLFGETENIDSSEIGETWYYHLNPGDGYLRFVKSTYRPRIWIFHFNKEGALTKFHFTDRRISGAKQ